MTLHRIAFAACLTALLAGEPLLAQATGMPTFFAPTRAFGSSELGLTLSLPDGDATGVEGRLGVALDQADLALRGGYVDGASGSDGSFVAGAEARVPVLGRTPTFPFDGGLILGIGRSFAGGGQTIVPIGLSVGRRLVLDGPAFQLTPYVQPTVIFASDTWFTFGLGVDLSIRDIPEVRANWAVGDLEGFSISLFWSR